MFYTPGQVLSSVEIVINDIGKDHIHGYVSAPKYRQSELASMANASDNPQDQNQAQASPSDQPVPRKKLTLPPE